MTDLLKMTIAVLLLWVAPLSASPLPGDNVLLDQETGARIEVLLESRSGSTLPLKGVARLLSHEQILVLYNKRGFLPVWMNGWQLKPEALTLMESLRNAGAHGLCGNVYLLAELENLILIQTDFAKHNLPLAPDNRAVLDLFLSQAFLTFATHLVEGQVDPAMAHVDWRSRRRKADLVKLLEYALENRRLSQVLEDLLPPHKEYQQLVEVLARYQRISAGGGWPEIPAGPPIRRGDRDPRVPLLRTLLMSTGDLKSNDYSADDYDYLTHAAVASFQLRHGLVDDGVVGSETLAVLNVPVEKRIRQIELNLERWRWMPKSFGQRHIRVNVADFSLEVFDDGEVVLQMPVIVGTQYRKTPVFSAQMTYLEFAPYWTVPPTILREDKLPKIKRQADYLEKHHFRIIPRGGREEAIDPAEIDWTVVNATNFPGLLRMEPGPWNPLGRVKFMFPNRFDVYLHDTNEANLFDKNVRSFSSGCIRVKQPRELAAYLLGWDVGKARLQELFAATVPEKISISPLAVHILYWTAWVDRRGTVHFRPDVYFRDLDLETALTEPDYQLINRLRVSAGTRLARN